jgi:hypothetical protein
MLSLRFICLSELKSYKFQQFLSHMPTSGICAKFAITINWIFYGRIHAPTISLWSFAFSKTTFATLCILVLSRKLPYKDVSPWTGKLFGNKLKGQFVFFQSFWSTTTHMFNPHYECNWKDTNLHGKIESLGHNIQVWPLPMESPTLHTNKLHKLQSTAWPW